MVACLGEQLDLVLLPTRRRICHAPGYCNHAGVAEMTCCLLCGRSTGVEAEVCEDVCRVAFEGERECQWLREEGA